MKKSVLILLFGLLVYNAAHAQKYLGKSYASTQKVDEYFDAADVKQEHTVMGKAELDKGFRSLEKCQLKIMELARKKGADGVIFSVEEEVFGTSSSSGGTVGKNKKNKTTVSSNNTTTNMKEKKIKGTFIKYN